MLAEIFHLMADHQRIEAPAGDLQEHRLIDQRAAEDAPEAIAHLDMLEAEGRRGAPRRRCPGSAWP